MVTTSDAIAFLRFSCLVPFKPFFTIPDELFWTNFVAKNILKKQGLIIWRQKWKKITKGTRKSIKRKNFSYKRFFAVMKKKTSLFIQLPYHLLRSIKEAIFPFFPTRCPRNWKCDQKDPFFLSKNNGNFVLNKNLDKFLFDQFLAIIVDRNLILKNQNLPLIFHLGDFAELGIRKALSRG